MFVQTLGGLSEFEKKRLRIMQEECDRYGLNESKLRSAHQQPASYPTAHDFAGGYSVRSQRVGRNPKVRS